MDKDYVGVSAFGLKLGAITPEVDLKEEVMNLLKRCREDNMIHDGDVLCVTESVLARSQNNFVTVDEVVEELHEKHGINENYTLLVQFPITSRNRFSAILRALARSVKNGRVIVQQSYPSDEVGNQVVEGELENDQLYRYEDIKNNQDLDFNHPITGINYLEFYEDIINEEMADHEIYLCNDPQALISEDIDAVIVSSIHRRRQDKLAVIEKAKKLSKFIEVMDLTSIFNDDEDRSRWGLLGSNLSAGEKIKLAPTRPFEFAEELKQAIGEELDRDVEVIIYGDGAYKDPESGIYELADPVTSFGFTAGLENRIRKGNKYKYLVDKYVSEGYEQEEIEMMIREEDVETEDEGTTPRKAKDLISSLADLVSGSADAGTPLVLVKNFFD